MPVTTRSQTRDHERSSEDPRLPPSPFSLVRTPVSQVDQPPPKRRRKSMMSTGGRAMRLAPPAGPSIPTAMGRNLPKTPRPQNKAGPKDGVGLENDEVEVVGFRTVRPFPMQLTPRYSADIMMEMDFMIAVLKRDCHEHPDLQERCEVLQAEFYRLEAARAREYQDLDDIQAEGKKALHRMEEASRGFMRLMNNIDWFQNTYNPQ